MEKKNTTKKDSCMITVTLSNGLSARIPVENYQKTIAKMEENIKRKNNH